MNTRHILLCLALSLLGSGLQAQTDLPQVFSPNAAELGKYGKIPVSYFNGLPNINIPLTELRAKGYTLPIYLTYHAGGNKPEQHPGWVGLGWTLHAGGCITRIVHGYRDEMRGQESTDMIAGTGYLLHAESFQQVPIDSTYLKQRFESGDRHDFNPDEFLVNMDGLYSSFFFVGDNAVRIESDSPVNYTVMIELEPSAQLRIFQHNGSYAQRYDSIRTITLTSSDGTIYRFGGAENANEYAFERASANGQPLIKRTTDTWNISSIQFPNGEEILFEYVKAGRPIICSDRYSYVHCSDNPANSGSPDGYTATSEVSYYLSSPSYLQRISSKISGEELDFTISQTLELVDTLDISTFNSKFIVDSGPKLQECVAQNYYQQLDCIETPRGCISFDYTESLQERLKLLGVTIGNPSIGKYEMVYNTIHLPGYRSRKTDRWGYYSQIQGFEETHYSHPVDTISAKAEILETLCYPTGGETRFEYEGHHYSKIANHYPFVLTSENGIAGGLRVRKVTDVFNGVESTRVLRYVNESGGSSGISALKPIFEEGGFIIGTPEPHQGSDTTSFPNLPPGAHIITYHLEGERPLNQIPRTKGCHVTYSRVEECFPDAGKNVYYYTNHEEFPDASFIWAATSYAEDSFYNNYCSHALDRGLLKRKEVYSDGASSPINVEEYDYYRDLTDNLQGIEDVFLCFGILHRCSHIRHYTYFPGLHHKIVTSYPDDGGTPQIETTEYTYDSHRRLTDAKRTVGGITERETFSYTGNFSAQPYAGMKSKNMIAYPVEHLIFRKDNPQGADPVVSAELTTWKQSDTLYVPAAKYRAALGSGMLLSQNNGPGFHRFDTLTLNMTSYGDIPELSFTKYDAQGNLLLSEDRGGTPTTYAWTENGYHPAAIFAGAKNGTRPVISVQHTNTVAEADLNGLSYSSVNIPFRCDVAGSVEISLLFNPSYGRTVWWRLDEGTEHQLPWSYSPPGPGEVQEAQSLFSGVLPVGNHLFQVTQTQGSYAYSLIEDPEEPVEEPDGEGGSPGPRAPSDRMSLSARPHRSLSSQTPSWGTVEVQYPVNDTTVTQVRSDDCLFEDFEDNASSPQRGFNSGKSFLGVKTLSFVPHPDKIYVIDWQEWQPGGGWEYRAKTVTSQESFTAGTAGKIIDHVRVFPVGTSVESYTWDTAGNLLSRTDSRGVTESYRYDALGRLVAIYDNEGKKVEEYQYNYQNR